MSEKPLVALVVDDCQRVVIPGRLVFPASVRVGEKLEQLLRAVDETVPGVGVPEQPNAHWRIEPLAGIEQDKLNEVFVDVDVVEGSV